MKGLYEERIFKKFNFIYNCKSLWGWKDEALAALPEDEGSIPRTHMLTKTHL